MAKLVGIGACVLDTLVRVPRYPAEDTKLRATVSRRAGGGPVATGLAAAARLGADAAYIGVLSDDAGGQFLLQDFARYGVDTACVTTCGGYRSFTSVVWLSEAAATRTCVFDKGDLPPLALDERQRDAVEQAELLLVDGNELDAAVEAAQRIHAAGGKVLYDAGGLYDGVERLLKLTDYLIPSQEFALAHTGCRTAEQAARALYDAYRPACVVITQGKDGGLLFAGDDVLSYPAYPAEVVDSNGAGDVFHGAFAAGLLKGYSVEQCCHFASAVSALKCTGFGARESVPAFDAVQSYLKENGYAL